MDDFANFVRGFAFEVRQLGADAEEMAVSGGYLDPGQNQETVDWLPVDPHQSFLQHVGYGVAGVVIGHGNAVQTFRLGGSDQVFRTRNSVTGEKRVSMEIKIKGHLLEC
jgi:hypothetical protein